MMKYLLKVIFCVSTSIFITFGSLSADDGELNEVGPKSIVISLPQGSQIDASKLISVLEKSDFNICGGNDNRNDNCFRVDTLGGDNIVNIPVRNCQLAPCLAGCPQAGELMCAPPMFKIMTEFQSRGSLLKSTKQDPAKDVNADYDKVREYSEFPAQGGGDVYVFTFGDGTHEAYVGSQETGFSIIESGGGAGGHKIVVDQLKNQWEDK